MKSDFIHLHVHSHYSLLSALPKIDELVKTAKKNGMNAIALTDNGNLYGAIEFYKLCKKENIKPIIGLDAYMSARTRHDKQAGIDNKRTRLLLLARDIVGYKNLIKLSTDSFIEGFYYKPRIDNELMEKYKEGLIAISPSFSGEIASALKYNDKAMALNKWQNYLKVFGKDNVFLEITHHPEIDGHGELMKKIIAFAKEHNAPLVASNDIYYIAPEDKKARDTLLAVNTHGDFSDRENDTADFSFTNSEQMEKWFKDNKEAISNTRKIADMCNLELELGKWVFPDFQLENKKTADEELKRLAYDGIKTRNLKDSEEIRKRIDYELKVIKDKGYSPYFLVVSDLLRFARSAGILTTTRGSAGGSMVSYLTYITTVNPIEYDLPFERFLNPERPSAPDIDMDMADSRRDEMIEYAKKKYGADKVAQIGTFGTMMARGSVRDVARALGYEYALGDKIAKLIPMGSQGFPMTIEHAFEIVPELKDLYKKEKGVKEIIDIAKKIEGCARHVSVHAAGVIISPTLLTDFVPLQYDPKGEGKIISQYDMYSVEEAGLLKFDFLGIKNLSILADAVIRVEKIENKKINLENIPLNDEKTFSMLSRGETIGVFQLNGDGMTKYLMDLKPTRVEDISVMVALYRPGPMDNINDYIARKNGKLPIKYLHPKMKDFLAKTYGVLVYQDDLLMTAIHIAGYSWGEVDKFRKAIGKKIPEEMAKQHKIFVEGCKKNSAMAEKEAEDLWKLFEPFQGYGFNKCLVGDTEIIEAGTGEIIKIKDICDKKLTPKIFSTDNDLKLAVKSPIRSMKNGVKEVFELTTKSGRKIRATANHPFLKFSGWINLDKLKVRDKIAVPRTLEYIKGVSQKTFMASVLGYLLSEGNLCHPNGIYFYSTKKDELADFIKNVSHFPNMSVTIDKSKSATSIYCGQKDQTLGNSLNQWIIKLGLKNLKATEKFIPNDVFKWDKNTLSILIGKMWQGDGCVSIKNEQIYYATSGEVLARNMQHILLRLGILSTIHQKMFNYRGEKKVGYAVVVTHRNNISKFIKTAGKHLIGYKKRDLEILISRSNNIRRYPARGTNDIVPAQILDLIRLEMKARNISTKEISKKTGLSERLFFHDARKIGYQREVIKLIGEKLKSKEILKYANSDIYWDEIKSIKKAGREMTYDLTVPPFNNFIANDIVVHNSHAASYGMLAYQTAYMKANFPEIYMSSVLTADSGDVEKIGETIAECKRINIPVLPPSINESFSQFTVVKNADGSGYKIRFGLVTIKNFGQGISTVIIEERKRAGKFKSLSDFLRRIKDRNLNKKSLEALIKSGAMDEFGERGQMIANMERLLAFTKESGSAHSDQTSLFGGITGKTENFDDLKLDASSPATQTEKLAWEKELLGLYISGHPLDKFKNVLEKREVNIKKVKEEMKEGMIVVVGGIVEEVRSVITKKNDAMAFVRLADLTGSIEVVIFPKVFEEFKNLIAPESCIAIKGRISYRNDEISIIAEKLKKLS